MLIQSDFRSAANSVVHGMVKHYLTSLLE